MAFLDLTNVDSGGALPDGNYTARIADTNHMESKSGRPMLKVMFEITSGQYTKRKVFTNYTLDNNTSVGILKRMVLAAGAGQRIEIPDYYGTKDNPARVEQLHGHELVITVKLKEGDEQYAARPEVVGYAPITDADTAFAA